MKKLLALALVVFGLAACQTEPEGFDVTVNGEVPVTVTVDLADAVGTRANSAAGAIDNKVVDSPDYILRYALQVFNADGTASKAIKYKYSNEKSVAFDLRLVPNRNYKFVVWADIVEENSGLTEDVKCDDLHYAIVDDLRNITLNNNIIAWEAMDETRDAYTGVHNANNFKATDNITIELTRPFAKLRVVTTDIAELFDGVIPDNAVATYTTEHRASFNAFTQKAGEATLSGVQHTFDIAGYNDADPTKNKTLFVDYFFAADQDDVVNFTLDVKEANGTTIKSNTFNTPIPVKRNFLTTIKGNVLTEGNKISIDIDDNFGENQENQENWGTISSQAELNAAVAAGGLYKVINLITLTNSGASTTAVRFATTPAPVETVIDLNGYTISGKNTGNTALITVADGNTLTFTGAGNVVLSSDSTGALIDNNGTVNIEGGTFENKNTTGNVSLIDNAGGTTNVNGGNIATDNVIEGGETQTTAELLADLFANGGELTLGENIVISAPLTATKAGIKIVLDGNGKTITYTGTDRVIDITNAAADADVTLKNLTIDVNSGYSNRGINYNSNGKLNIHNVTVNGGYEVVYVINLPGMSDYAKVNITNSDITGIIPLNIWGSNAVVNVTDSDLTSLDNEESEDYAAVKLCNNTTDSSAEDTVVTIEGGSIIARNEKGEPSYATTNATLTGEINISSTTEVVGEMATTIAIVTFNGQNEFYGCYSLKEAIEQAQTSENVEEVRVIRDYELNEMITVNNGENIVLNLNGKTITGTDTTSKNFSLIHNCGTLLVKNGTMTLTATVNSGWGRYSAVLANNPGGNLTVENVTLEHLGGTDMAYGIDNLTNGKGTSAVTTINDRAVVKSPYRAVRQFLNGVEATNELYINAGAKIEGANKSVWLQDPNANANSGKIVVEEGAELNGDVYLYVTPGSTEWPVEVSINASAVNGEVLTGNVPEGYGLINENGVWKIVKDGVNNYILISTAERLKAFANDVNVNNDSFSGKKVYLVADIDLKNEAWTPIGQTGATTFNGVFDGQNHTISNLNVNSEDKDGAHYSSGLFGWVESHTANCGHIKNVKINGATIVGHHNCGALVGYITQQTALVENCHVVGAEVSCTRANGDADGDKAGALIGNATVATPVKNCTAANSTVSAGRDAGQVIGAGNEANVTGCSATDVTVEANGTGTGANIRNEVIGRLLQ